MTSPTPDAFHIHAPAAWNRRARTTVQTEVASIVCPLITRKPMAEMLMPQPAYRIFVAPTSAAPMLRRNAHLRANLGSESRSQTAHAIARGKVNAASPTLLIVFHSEVSNQRPRLGIWICRHCKERTRIQTDCLVPSSVTQWSQSVGLQIGIRRFHRSSTCKKKALHDVS